MYMVCVFVGRWYLSMVSLRNNEVTDAQSCTIKILYKPVIFTRPAAPTDSVEGTNGAVFYPAKELHRHRMFVWGRTVKTYNLPSRADSLCLTIGLRCQPLNHLTNNNRTHIVYTGKTSSKVRWNFKRLLNSFTQPTTRLFSHSNLKTFLLCFYGHVWRIPSEYHTHSLVLWINVLLTNKINYTSVFFLNYQQCVLTLRNKTTFTFVSLEAYTRSEIMCEARVIRTSDNDSRMFCP